MDIVRSISKNTAFLIGGEICGKLISVFVSIAFVRHLGAVELGKYSFAMAYLFFFAVLPHLSHESILGREVAVAKGEDARKILGDAILLRLLLALGAMCIAWIGLLFFNTTSEIKLLVFVASLGMMASFRSLFIAVFQKTMEMEVYTVANTSIRLLSALLTLGLIFLNGKVLHFMLLNIFVAFATGLFMYFLSQKRIPIQWEWNRKRMSAFLKQSFPVSVSHFFDRVIARVDQLFLFSIVGISSLGLYSATVTIVEAFLFIPTALLTVMLPVLSVLFVESEQKHRKSVEISGKYLLLFSLPTALFITFYADQVLIFLFGESFSAASSVLKILIWSLPLNFMLILLRHVLISVKKQKIILFGSAFGALVNVPLNFILIPKYGASGAALATVIAYVIPFLCFLFDSVSRELTLRSYGALFKLIPALIILFVLLYFLSINWWFSLFLSSFIYLVSLYLTKGLDQKDFNLFKRAIGLKYAK